MSEIMTKMRGLVGGYTPAERVLDHHPDFQVKHVDDLLCRAADEIERITAERDEARRLYCRMSAECIYLSRTVSTAKFVAKENGWDCFKEKTP